MSKNFVENTVRTKSKMMTVAVLVITLAASMMLLPQAEAADLPLYAFLAVRPNPVGVGQQILISVFVDRLAPGFGASWRDWEIKITDPDGVVKTEVLDSDPIASAWITYTPSKVGTYEIDFTSPEQDWGTNNYLEAKAPTVYLEVQEEPIEQWPGAPLPTAYWERPIDAQNREWFEISNNWYGVPIQYGNTYNGRSNWLPYGSAPESAHVLWTEPLYPGGLVGGEFNSYGYYTGLSYENKWTPPVVLSGMLFYNERMGSSGPTGVRAIDVSTGETIWYKESMSITCGSVLRFDSENQHGAIPYLWSLGGRIRLYDPYTGTQILEIENASTGRYALDDNGNLLTYRLSNSDNTLIMWNSTKCIQAGQAGGLFGGDPFWRPRTNAVLEWSEGIEFNTTIPDEGPNVSIVTMGDDVIIGVFTPEQDVVGIAGYSKEDGSRLFSTTTPGATGSMFMTAESEGKFAFFRQETMTWTGFNAQTGAKLWGPTAPYDHAWGIYSSSVGGLGGASPVIAYGKLYSVAYDGKIRCYDMETGDLEWQYFIGNSGFESPYGGWPLGGGLHFAADGKIYATVGEHSPTIPLIRGARIVCVNATTGDELWYELGWFQTPVVSDGRILALNHYDGQIYCFGKGPSATTVSVGPKYSTLGEKVVIEGNVLDTSLGTKQTEAQGRFPTGVPAVSDDSMNDWMAYVYSDQPLPTDATGVEVWIDVLDANGNYRNVGTTMSDMSGFFSFEWEPDIPGMYTVVATFAGSNAYYASYAETAFTVVEPVVTPAPTPTPAPMTDTYVTGFGIGIIVAIIVIGLVLILMLRKR